MSIGDTLAQARRQADLTVTQVSQRTCIRETIIRGIERGDYSACGGDFYARGHIRSIARAVGVDPEPLVREYDQTQGAPQPITAADVFEPATPIKIRERRRPNWTAAMVVALAAVVGFVAYHEVSSHSGGTHNAASSVSAASHPRATPKASNSPATRPGPTATPAVLPYANEVVISLKASQPCWVLLTTASGQQVYQGVVAAGTTMNWTERQAVTLKLGNPRGVTLTVNGQNKPQNNNDQPVTLSYATGPSTSG